MGSMAGTEKKSQENQIVVKVVDFDSLVEMAKQMPFEEGQYFLWEEVYKLPKWHFAVKSTEDINQLKPFICDVDGKAWFCASTDGKHAVAFAKRQGFIYPGGNILTIGMNPLEAVNWMSEYKEIIYGVRFNEGEYGWFSPIENLLPMYEHLKGLNKHYC
jgi:hypothetical protein